MGYITAPDGTLACDACGTPGARLRKCPYWVTEPGGQRLRYCSPAALCDPCLAKAGGSAKLHARCEQGAADSQAENDARVTRLDAGELFIGCALSGAGWYLPAGQVGAEFTGRGGTRTWLLVPEDEYQRAHRAKGLMLAVSDFPGAPVWEDNPDARRAREAGMTHLYWVAPLSLDPDPFEAFEVPALDAGAASAAARQRLGHERYSVVRKDTLTRVV